MHTIDALRSRRAVKTYLAGEPVPERDQRQMLELAMLSPTAFNLQHWRFVLVDDPQLRQALRAVAWDQPQVTDAGMLVVICADLDSWDKQADRVWAAAPEALQDFLLPAIDACYRDRPQMQRDEAMRSCGIAAQSLMLAARAFGYHSCPMDGFDFHRVAELLHLPHDHCVALMVAIGRSDEVPAPRIGRLPWEEVVVRNRF